MFLIDPRAGSQNLPKLFPADMVHVFELPAGDVWITDQSGDELFTVVEHKKVNDVLQCIVTGRFAGTQLPRIDEVSDDYWLLIEGPLKQGHNGELLVPSTWKHDQWNHAKVGGRHFQYGDLMSWIITMTTLTPLKVHITGGRLESRDWLNTLHWWWEKGKDKHRSHMVLDKSRDNNGVNLAQASPVREWAERLPGIGFGKAISVEGHFDTPFDMAIADEAEWQKIEGIGPKMAERIVRWIRENHRGR